MINEHNQKYIDAMAVATRATADEVVNNIITAFHAQHRLAELRGDSDHLMLAFARGEEGRLLAGKDLYVFLQANYRNDLERMEKRVAPEAQARISELEQLLSRHASRVSPRKARKIAEAAGPKLPPGTGVNIGG